MSRPPETIHFILSANAMGSGTRVAVEFANCLVERGFRVVVSVPYFNYWDFVLWGLHREIGGVKNPWRVARAWLSWVAYPLVKAILLRKRWYGQTIHPLHEKVRVNRFLLVPSAGNIPDADWIVVFQCYLIPRLLYLPPSKGRVVGGIRLDYLAGEREPNPLKSEWRRFCNSIEQRLNVPLFSCSVTARASARALGIHAEPIIYNGINLKEFTDSHRRGDQDPIRITMFCHDHPQKGQDFGCQVIRRLREESFPRRVLFCSLGERVKPAHRGLFDVHYGYLTGPAYVRVYQETDIFLFPSLYEGFPAPPLEAMACGCALAATRVSGIDEYGIHGKNCMMAYPNDVEGMCRNVRALICDAVLRDAIRENGWITVQGHSWEKSTDQLIDFLHGPLDSERHQEEKPVLASAGVPEGVAR